MQPRDDAEIANALTQPLRSKKRMLKITWAPDISRGKKRELHSRRQYSNDAVRSAVQRHRLIHHGGIAAKPRMPKRVTDHDHRLACGLSFIRLKKTAQLRLDAQHVNKIGRYSGRRDLQRLASTREIEVVIGRRRNSRKRP